MKGKLAKQKINFNERDEKLVDGASYYTPLKKKILLSPIEDKSS
jgi:hypothetical protein